LTYHKSCLKLGSDSLAPPAVTNPPRSSSKRRSLDAVASFQSHYAQSCRQSPCFRRGVRTPPDFHRCCRRNRGDCRTSGALERTACRCRRRSCPWGRVLKRGKTPQTDPKLIITQGHQSILHSLWILFSYFSTASYASVIIYELYLLRDF